MPSFFSKNLALFNTIILLINSIQVHTQTVNIGDEVCVAGYIMDTFCIDRGTLLDRPSLTTLGPEGPPGHSVHCLVDVGICNRSPFEVLKELDDGSFGRAWRVDNNDLLLNHARSIGRCSTCDGSGDLVRGYQATVIGTVQELASGEIPPVISVSEVGAFEDFESLCAKDEAQNVDDIEDNEINLNSNSSVNDFDSNFTLSSNHTSSKYINETNSSIGSSNHTRRMLRRR